MYARIFPRYYRRRGILRRPKFDKKYFKVAAYSFAVLALCILLNRFLDNIGGFFGTVGSLLMAVKGILITFIYGFFIAFFFTPLVNFLEKFIGTYVKRLRERPKLLRNITIFITYAIFIGCFTWLMIYMIPTVAQSFRALISALPESMASLMETLPETLSKLDPGVQDTVVNTIIALIEPIQEKINDLPNLIGTFFNGQNFIEFVSSTVNVVKVVVNFIIGIIISFYMLSTKEELAAGCKKLCLAVFEEGKAERFIRNMQRVNEIFQNFVLGKLLDAIALGVMCFIGALVLRIPYALVISVIIGVSNMIPYVGPFIGTIPSVFIVLLLDPMKALWLLIYILIIQQVDNYVLCPRLLGDTTGLTPLEVLFAIAVGAYFGGAFGMFFGVPVVASFKLFISEAVNRKFREKYPHGSTEFPKDDDAIWDYTDEDFVEDIPDD